MAVRVVIGKLHHGDGEGKDNVRTEFGPGEIIDTEDLNLSDEDVARMDALGVFRPRMDAAAVPEQDRPVRRGRPPRRASGDDL